MKSYLLFLIAVAASCMASAQNAPVQPKFEVASVKRADQCFGARNSIDPGSVSLRGMPLKIVLMEAFKVKAEQVEGPSWLDADCFDIFAKIPEGVPSNQVPAMLQALLTERFRLAAHEEDRPRSGFALVVDKGGPKFKEDDPKANFMRGPDGKQLTFFGFASHGGVKGVMTMAMLAGNLSREVYGPVEDATGLAGKYDIDLTWAREPGLAPREPTASASALPAADIPAPEGPSLFTALRDSLGLRLERRNVPVRFVVVEHIERTPTEN
ncbi:MAG: TIGR03435 family protein [Candidatus Solibacter sp.]